MARLHSGIFIRDEPQSPANWDGVSVQKTFRVRPVMDHEVSHALVRLLPTCSTEPGVQWYWIHDLPITYRPKQNKAWAPETCQMSFEMLVLKRSASRWRTAVPVFHTWSLVKARMS